MEISSEPEPTRLSTDSTNREFEFWMVGNPSFTDPNLLTADELFSDGLLLPLHLLPLSHPEPTSEPIPEPGPEPEPEPEPNHTPSSSPLYPSKRWKDIFKVGEKRKEERKNSSADLNINIWPFSRSRSDRTAGRPKTQVATVRRKASSAPCSRSNSRGESSKPISRKWAASPGRAGIHIGRPGPVWKAGPKGRGGKESGGGGVKVLSLNVNTCIGYGHQRSCSGDDKDGVTDGDRIGGGGGNGSLFGFRTLFSKKVY